MRKHYIKKETETEKPGEPNHHTPSTSPADNFRSALNGKPFKTGDEANHQSEEGGFKKSNHDIINQQTAQNCIEKERWHNIQRNPRNQTGADQRCNHGANR